MRKTIDFFVKGIVVAGLITALGCGSQPPSYIKHGQLFISFKDDQNIEAYITYGDLEEPIPMPFYNKSEDSYKFRIPVEAFNEDEFTVYAIDPDGNKSKEISFYIESGFVILKK